MPYNFVADSFHTK